MRLENKSVHPLVRRKRSSFNHHPVVYFLEVNPLLQGTNLFTPEIPLIPTLLLTFHAQIWNCWLIMVTFDKINILTYNLANDSRESL